MTEAELPTSLSFLNIVKNPCCEVQKGLQQLLELSLPNLKEINNFDLPATEADSYKEISLEDENERAPDKEDIGFTQSNAG